MKLFKKALAGVAVAAALATSAQASIITVQGVSWDPDQVTTATQPADFAATSNFTQWYQLASAFDPAGGAVNYGGDATILQDTFVTGAGKFNLLNGVNQIPSDPNPETNPGIFAPNRELTYTFGGIKITSVTVDPVTFAASFTFDLTNSYINVYSDSSRNYAEGSGLANQINAADSDFATPFLTGRFDTFATSNAIGSTTQLFGFADGLISVLSGAAFDNFNTDGEINPLTGFASDLTFTGSSQTLVGSNISTVGTAELQGNTVPEPESLALVGLGLLGLAAARRRKITN